MTGNWRIQKRKRESGQGQLRVFRELELGWLEHNWGRGSGCQGMSPAVLTAVETRTGGLCTGQVDQVDLKEDLGSRNSGEVRKPILGFGGCFHYSSEKSVRAPNSSTPPEQGRGEGVVCPPRL